MRVRTIAVLLLGPTIALTALALPASADEDHGSSTTSSTPVPSPEGVGIGDGIFLTGAVVTPPGDEPPRTLDAYDAAVFVQSWIASAYFGGEDFKREPPPPDLPVYRVDSTGEWGGSTAQGTVTVYYATDGTTAYIAFPGLAVWTDPAEAPPPSGWFSPPARVIDAFNGDAELEETYGTQSATTTTTVPPLEPEAGDSDATSRWPWTTITTVAVLVVGLLVLVVLVWRARGSRSSTETT